MSGENNAGLVPDTIMEQMAAAAFGALCEHLHRRSDEVQNIDLMTIGGFCRNCLAKVMNILVYFMHNILFIILCVISPNMFLKNINSSPTAYKVDGIRSAQSIETTK